MILLRVICCDPPLALPSDIHANRAIRNEQLFFEIKHRFAWKFPYLFTFTFLTIPVSYCWAHQQNSARSLMKACSHIKDFSELFREENSACLVQTVVASFGHLLNRGQPGVHKGLFLFTRECPHLVYIVCALLRGEDAICAYLHFTGITLRTEAPSLCCSCWFFLWPQLSVPALLHIPFALPLLEAGKLQTPLLASCQSSQVPEHSGCMEDGKCVLEAKRKLNATSKQHANIYLFSTFMDV